MSIQSKYSFNNNNKKIKKYTTFLQIFRDRNLEEKKFIEFDQYSFATIKDNQKLYANFHLVQC